MSVFITMENITAHTQFLCPPCASTHTSSNTPPHQQQQQKNVSPINNHPLFPIAVPIPRVATPQVVSKPLQTTHSMGLRKLCKNFLWTLQVSGRYSTFFSCLPTINPQFHSMFQFHIVPQLPNPFSFFFSIAKNKYVIAF